MLAQAPLAKFVCEAALKSGIKHVSQDVLQFLSAAVQVGLQ